MRCLTPITLRNQNLSEQIKFGGRYRLVPCGKCEACIDTKRKEWLNRLKQEAKHAFSSYFITLTYADYALPRNSLGYPCFSKRDVQLFMKRLRRDIERKCNDGFPINVRYFIISEYGSKFGRPHYHGILFNVPFDENETWRLVEKSWSNGRISCTPCCPERIGYCANYMYGKSEHMPDLIADDDNKIIMLSSRRPGIGSSYLTPDVISWHHDKLRNWYQDDNVKYALPRYWKDKIFDDIQKLAIFKENQKRIKEEELEELAERLEWYQKYGYNVPTPTDQRKATLSKILIVLDLIVYFCEI